MARLSIPYTLYLIVDMLINAIIHSFFGDGEMSQSVRALAFHCQAIGATVVVGSSPIGEASKDDFASPQQPGCIPLHIWL